MYWSTILLKDVWPASTHLVHPGHSLLPLGEPKEVSFLGRMPRVRATEDAGPSHVSQFCLQMCPAGSKLSMLQSTLTSLLTLQSYKPSKLVRIYSNSPERSTAFQSTPEDWCRCSLLPLWLGLVKLGFNEDAEEVSSEPKHLVLIFKGDVRC